MGIQQWTKVFGYRQMTEVIENTRQKVKVVFLEKENSMLIKLIEPSGKDSPVFEYSKKGGGLHHLCFKCDSIKSEIQNLKEKKFRLITAPEPGEAFGDELIAFLFGQNGLNIELIDTGKKANKILP